MSLATCETFDLTQVLRCHLQQLQILETHGASDGLPFRARCRRLEKNMEKALEKAMENGEIWDFIWIYMGIIWDIMGYHGISWWIYRKIAKMVIKHGMFFGISWRYTGIWWEKKRVDNNQNDMGFNQRSDGVIKPTILQWYLIGDNLMWSIISHMMVWFYTFYKKTRWTMMKMALVLEHIGNLENHHSTPQATVDHHLGICLPNKF